ncbi:hypothetical protein [Lolliginicoccus levis]|uniref:hypothetical protein n=1 Tax=Lolliginicoccus levis TaxID=2919542 RepID=UPI00241F4294|nr:hypothetical protein [Lolliginicoccus levis]
MGSAEPDGPRPPSGDDRVERWEQSLALPVLVAALVSVPAVFLTLIDGPLATLGHIVNWLTALVIVGESLVLMMVSGDAWRWATRHKWTLLLTAAMIPAVVLAIGPLQIVRAIAWLGALRILRVSRIIKAGRIMQQRTGMGRRSGTVVIAGLTVVATVFVVFALADPGSGTRQAASWVLDNLGPVPAIVAGLIVFATTLVTLRYRQRRS